MLYFDHDTSAVGDPKIAELVLECGAGALAAYWVVLEQIYRDETPLVLFANREETELVSEKNQVGFQPITKVVSHWLDVEPETLVHWVSTMIEIGLLKVDAENPNAVTSTRAETSITAYREKRETARQNGKMGGRKPKGNQVGSRAETKSVSERKPNAKLIKEKEEEKVLDTHKGYPNTYASADAAAADAAPPSAQSPFCPLCDVKMWKNTQTGRYHCPNCQDAFDKAKAEWR